MTVSIWRDSAIRLPAVVATRGLLIGAGIVRVLYVGPEKE